MNLGELSPSREQQALNWCAFVEEALHRLKPFWFDLWLRAVGDGPDEIRLMKAERLLPVFRVEQAKAEQEAVRKLTRERSRRPQ